MHHVRVTSEELEAILDAVEPELAEKLMPAAWKRELRDHEIVVQARCSKLPKRAIGAMFGVSEQTVYRVLRKHRKQEATDE